MQRRHSHEHEKLLLDQTANVFIDARMSQPIGQRRLSYNVMNDKSNNNVAFDTTGTVPGLFRVHTGKNAEVNKELYPH